MNALILIVMFAGGYFTGHENSTVTCQNEALIVSACLEIHPPSNDTFGATTDSYTSLVTTYRKCKEACVRP